MRLVYTNNQLDVYNKQKADDPEFLLFVMLHNNRRGTRCQLDKAIAGLKTIAE